MLLPPGGSKRLSPAGVQAQVRAQEGGHAGHIREGSDSSHWVYSQFSEQGNCSSLQTLNV